MKRFLTRHMSLRRHGRYTLLSSSDSQLHCDRTYGRDTKERDCSRPEESHISTERVSQRRKRPWYKLSRRRKRRENESTIVEDGESGAHFTEEYEDFEIATEASPCQDLEGSYTGHATLTRSASTSRLDVRNVGIDAEHYDMTGMLEATSHNEHYPQIHSPNVSGPKPAHLEGRRFAICEELEREIIMKDGVNLRKSRKNLVIRQVLHDLLLL